MRTPIINVDRKNLILQETNANEVKLVVSIGHEIFGRPCWRDPLHLQAQVRPEACGGGEHLSGRRAGGGAPRVLRLGG
jgi:hypothetical protein